MTDNDAEHALEMCRRDLAAARQTIDTLRQYAAETYEMWTQHRDTEVGLRLDAMTALQLGSRVRLLAPCGHPLDDSRNVGTPEWQNKWECQTCGHVWSR